MRASISQNPQTSSPARWLAFRPAALPHKTQRQSARPRSFPPHNQSESPLPAARATRQLRPRPTQNAAVRGLGPWGARIAALFPIAVLPSILPDFFPPALNPAASPADRNKIVRAGLEAAKKSRPAAFFTPALAEKIS